MSLLLVAMTARRVSAPALVALLTLSCGRSLMVDGPSPPDKGAGGTGDFDPGPAVDPIFGETSFVSRFTF